MYRCIGGAVRHERGIDHNLIAIERTGHSDLQIAIITSKVGA